MLYSLALGGWGFDIVPNFFMALLMLDNKEFNYVEQEELSLEYLGWLG